MPEIRQSDIFVFLTDRKLFWNPSYTQFVIAKELNVLKGGTGNKISDIIRGKDNGLENLKPEDIYKKFFRPMESNSEHFRRLKNAVKNGLKPRKGRKERKGPLTFDGWDREGDTYHDYVIRMLEEALPRWEKPSGDEQQASDADSPVYPFEDDDPSCLKSFTGRDELLADIQKRLDRDRCVALSGIGGIGKSALAQEFAARNKERYSPIQMVSSEEFSSFKKVVLKLRFEGLKDEPEDIKGLYEKKKELLKRLDERTLIIIDNVDKEWMKEEKEEFDELRSKMKCRLIITSRFDPFSSLPLLTVKELSPDDQQKLFFHHYEGKPLDPTRLKDLLNRIDGHTQLIELIAKTMAFESTSPEDMLEWFSAPKSDYVYMDDNQELKNPKQVIHEMLFRVKTDEGQKELLYRLTFLPDEGISRTLFLKIMDGLCRPRASIPLNFLERSGWVSREGDQIRIRPFIRQTVREDIPPEWWEWDHRKFLKNIREAMEAEDLDEKEQISLGLLARNVCEALHKNHKVPIDLWDDLLEIAKRCKATHQYETAKRLCESLEGISEGAKPEERVELFLELGSIHQHWSNYGKACKLYEQALNETQRDDNWRGSCYKSLGVAYEKDAYYDKAEDCFKEALNCYERKDLIRPVLYDLIKAPDGSGVVTAQETPGVMDELALDVITAQDDLGRVYRHLGEMKKDKKYYRKAKEIAEAVLALRKKLYADDKRKAKEITAALLTLGEELDDERKAKKIAKDIPALGETLDNERKAKETLYADGKQKAKEIAEAVLELGETLDADGKQKAEEIAKAVLELWEKLYADNKALAVSHHRIGSACYCLGDYNTALKEHELAEALRPGIAASYHWIGKDYLQLARQDGAKLDEEKLREAKKNLEKSLRLREEHLNKDHPEVAKSLMSLGEYYETAGDLEKAIENTEKAYNIRVDPGKGLRDEHPYITQAERRLEELKEKRKKQAPVSPEQE